MNAHRARVDERPQNILDLIRPWAARRPEAAALEAPGVRPLAYRDLISSIESIAADLMRLGVQSTDRIALVHLGGPDLAAAMLAIASVSVCAPLNAAYQEPEFELYLTNLEAKAVVVGTGFESVARVAADKLGIRVLDLTSDADARAIAIDGASIGPPRAYRVTGPDGHALVLHTSGTTSRPKLAPLTHANLCAAARGLGRALDLGPADRCLNVMPLFHIHGISAGLLAPLASGGTSLCTPGFHAPSFFSWMEQLRPTWYTAAPTIHQAILARARIQRRTFVPNALRFIRSASAPLAPTVMRELESLFDAPVIECYAMTEAASVITANPLPPAVRKPGSVGLSIGTDVAIVGERGLVRDANVEGEVVIRGPSVIAGYTSASTNAESFTDGWLKTGDIGRFDEDGYLFLVGRSKEIINRGSEKIAPGEIDDALLAHPDVEQAVAFAIPDPMLGEDVSAVVVLKAGASRSEHDLRDFVSQRLAFFKVPRRILVVDRIPVGASGKTQRSALAKMLDVHGSTAVAPTAAPFAAPRTPVEEFLARTASELLAIDRIGIRDDLFRLGLDSIIATQMLARIRKSLSVELPLLALFESATIADLGLRIEGLLRHKPS